MAQFDIYRNTNPSTSDIYPYLLDIQNDLLSMLQTRVVVPLATGITPIKHLNPSFTIENHKVTMSTADMASIPLLLCSELVINISNNRDKIIDALDFMVNGF